MYGEMDGWIAECIVLIKKFVTTLKDELMNGRVIKVIVEERERNAHFGERDFERLVADKIRDPVPVSRL